MKIYVIAILDFIKNPPTDDKYTALKIILIDRFSDSEEKRLEALLSKHDIDVDKPSQFLRRLKILAGSPKLISKSILKKTLDPKMTIC